MQETPLNAKDNSHQHLLEAWVEEYGDYLFRYAFRYFRTEDSAQDLVQETFLAAAESIERFEGRSTPKTWLTGILRHKILDQIKSKVRQERFEVTDYLSEEHLVGFDQAEHWTLERGPLPWGSAPDHVIKQKQFVSVLDSCLRKLPERIRQIFLLRELEGRNRTEISVEFELTESNIGVILHRARIALQGCLQENWLKGGRV